MQKEIGDTVPKNSKTTLKEAAEVLSNNIDVKYGTNYPDFYMYKETDTPTYHFDIGSGEVLLQYSSAQIIVIVIYKNKSDDEPATTRYITQQSYKDSKEIMEKVIDVLKESNIDYVIENINSIIPPKPSFSDWFARKIQNLGIFD